MKLSKYKSDTAVTNLTQMIVKDLHSFMEVLGLSNHIKLNTAEAVVYKIKIVKLAPGEDLEIESTSKRISFVKLFSHSPSHTNALGTVLQ